MDKFDMKSIRVRSRKKQQECADYLSMPISTYRLYEEENTFSLYDAFRLAQWCGIQDMNVIDPMPTKLKK